MAELKRSKTEVVSPARKLSALIGEVGLPDAMLRCVSRLVRAITFDTCDIRRYYIFCQPLEAIPRTRLGAAICVRRISPHDPIADDFPRPAWEIRERFSRKSTMCFVAESAGELAGFMWVDTAWPFPDQESGIEFFSDFPATTAWDFDMYVAPAYRGSLVFFRLWSAVSAHLLKQCRWSASLVWSQNDASINAHRRLGSYPIASGYQIKIGSRLMPSGAMKIIRVRRALSCRRFRRR